MLKTPWSFSKWKKHLLIVWIIFADNNSPLWFQIHQSWPINKHWVLHVRWYNECIKGELDPFLCGFQNDRQHNISQRSWTLGIHNVNRLSGISFIESRSLCEWDGVVKFLNSAHRNRGLTWEMKEPSPFATQIWNDTSVFSEWCSK